MTARIVAAALLLCALAVPVASADVYWAARSPTNAIGRAGDDGCKPNRGFITGLHDPLDVAVAGGHVYWTSYDGGNGHYIGRADLDGKNVDEKFIDIAVPGNDLDDAPFAIAANATHVYWSDDTKNIGRAKLDGTGIEPSIVSDFSQGIAIDGSHLYWAGSHGTNIGRSNLDGSNPEPGFISTPLEDKVGLAISGDSLYYAAFTPYDPDGPEQQKGIWRVKNLANAASEYITPFETTEGLNNLAVLGVAASPTQLFWSGPTEIGRATLAGTATDPTFVPVEDGYQVAWTPTDAACKDPDVPPAPTPGPTPGPTSTPSPSATPDPKKHATALQVLCTYTVLTKQDKCTATVGDADAMPTTPSGQVTFAAAQGGFPFGKTCTLSASPSAPTAPSCSIQYIPPGGTSAIPALTATYAGDGTHNGSTGATTLLAAGGGINYNAPTGAGGNYPNQVTLTTTVAEDDSTVTGCASTAGGAKAFAAQGGGGSFDAIVRAAAEATRQAEQATAAGKLKEGFSKLKEIAEKVQSSLGALENAKASGSLDGDQLARAAAELTKGESALKKIGTALKKTACSIEEAAGGQRLASIAKRKARKAVKLGSVRRTGVKRGTAKVRIKLSRKAVRRAAGKRKRLKVKVSLAVIAPSGIPILSTRTVTLKRR